MNKKILTPDDYDYKIHWDIDYDIYCAYANLSDNQIDLYASKIKTALTKDGNFAHVEIDGDGTLITIWADSDTADLDSFYALLDELSALGAIVEQMPKEIDYVDEMEDSNYDTMPVPETFRNNTENSHVTTVYKKAVVYFKADIEYSNNKDLQEKLEDFESKLCLDLDNLPSGYCDYDFRYDGISDISEDDIPDWFFD